MARPMWSVVVDPPELELIAMEDRQRVGIGIVALRNKQHRAKKATPAQPAAKGAVANSA